MNLVSFFKKRQTLLGVFLILAVAVFFRLWQLDQIPPGLYPDVAMNGNDALSALAHHDFKIFYPENNGREGFFINLIALSFQIFGASVWAIKIVPAVLGILTVLGTFLLARQLFLYLGRKPAEVIALLSSFFLAISFWHVNFSRLGFRAIMVPFCLVWSFYYLYRGATTLRPPVPSRTKPQTGSRLKAALFFIIGGLSLGLGFHTYIAFRVAPLILLPAFLFAILNFGAEFKKYAKRLKFVRAFFKTYFGGGWYNWDLFLTAALLVMLPMAIYFWHHPTEFIGRAGQVSIFASANPIKTLAISTAKTLGQFVVSGDNNWRHNLAGSPEIAWPLIPLFLIGLFFCCLQIFRRSSYQKQNWPRLQTHTTLLFWWGAMLLPSIMSNEGLPHALRSIGAVVPSLIFTGVGFALVIGLIKIKFSGLKTRIAGVSRLNFLIFLFLAFVLVLSYYNYFIRWGHNPEVAGAFTVRFVDEAQYLNSLPPTTQKWVIVNEDGVPVPYPNGLPMPVETIMFISRLTPNLKYLANNDSAIATALTNNRQNQPMVILPMKDDETLFQKLAKLFPQGQRAKINDFEVLKINY